MVKVDREQQRASLRGYLAPKNRGIYTSILKSCSEKLLQFWIARLAGPLATVSSYAEDREGAGGLGPLGASEAPRGSWHETTSENGRLECGGVPVTK